MSDTVNIDFQEFRSLDAGLESSGEVKCGVLVYDQFDCTFMIIGARNEARNMLNDYGDDPLCRALGVEHRFRNRVSAAIIDFALRNNKGLVVNGTYYENEKVHEAMNRLMN